MNRCLLLLALLTASLSNVCGQQPDSTQVDLIDLLFGKKKTKQINQYRAEKKVHFSVLPAAVNVPGGGRAVITAVNAAFYLGDPTLTNLSNIYLIPYTNLADRYGLFLRPNLWLTNNSFNLQGDYRIANFPQYTWGLGGNTPEWDRSLIDTDYIRVYQTVLIKIYRKWYFGPGYNLDYYYNIEESDFSTEGGHLGRYPVETGNESVSSGLTFQLVYDDRTNAINPPRGHFFQITWRRNTTELGSTFDNNSLFIDGRKYIPFSQVRTHILALRSYYWTVLNGQTPYLDLPLTNAPPTTGYAGRGFEYGRHRSNAILYTEAEHRYQLSHNGLCGVVIFMHASSASEFETQNFNYWQVGAGFGLRFKLNKYAESNMAIDLGFTKNYWGVWLNIGEMF